MDIRRMERLGMTREDFINNLLKTYRLIKVLADKNGCKVLRLRHKNLERDIVLHSFPEAIYAYELLCNIKHENLPIIYDSIMLDDGQIVLEEFIDGVTVAEILETGLYRYIGAKRVVVSVCNALDVLHKSGIIHRDIKPENVIIDKNGRVVLIDFNASRRLSNATKDTVVMGTVGYASPEQLGVAQSDPRTDIYALGVLLNVMLTGKHPCEHLAKGKARKIVNKCTNINPDQRYQTVESLIKAL